METMKAVRIHKYGGPEVLVNEDARRPKSRRGEVLIRVHEAGVNPVDWRTREGYLKQRHPSLPVIPGWDVSGVVQARGPGVSGLKKGDEVYALSDIARDGAYTEYIVVRESEVALKPKSIDHIHAAAIPLGLFASTLGGCAGSLVRENDGLVNCRRDLATIRETGVVTKDHTEKFYDIPPLEVRRLGEQRHWPLGTRSTVSSITREVLR